MIIHDLDMARFLLGQAFVFVYEVGSAPVDPTAPAPTIYDGLAAQNLADAATESWETGKPVVA